MAAEALSNYNLDALRKDLYLAPNEKFDALVVKCYERLNNKKILAFPDNSERNEVSDVRWHIAGVGVGNYVHWRTDDLRASGQSIAARAPVSLTDRNCEYKSTSLQV